MTSGYETYCCHLYESGDRLHAKFADGVIGDRMDSDFYYTDIISLYEKRNGLIINRIYEKNGNKIQSIINNVRSFLFRAYDITLIIKQFNFIGMPFYYEEGIKYDIIWLVWLICAEKNEPFDVNKLHCSHPNSIYLKPDDCYIACATNFSILNDLDEFRRRSFYYLHGKLSRLPKPNFLTMKNVQLEKLNTESNIDYYRRIGAINAALRDETPGIWI